MRGAVSSLSSRALIFQVPYIRVVRRRFVRVRVQLYTLYTLAYTRRFSLKGSSVWTSFVTTSIVCVIHAECAERRNYRTDRAIGDIPACNFRLCSRCVDSPEIHWNPFTFNTFDCDFVRSSVSLSFISSDLEKVRLSRDNSILPRAANHWKEDVQRECKVAHNGSVRDYRPSF